MNEKRVGFGPRFLAALIDAVIIIVVVGVITLIFRASWLGNVLRTVFVVGYAFQEVIKAATPGKMAMGLKIGGADGNPASSDALMKRFVIKHSSNLLGLVAAIIPFLFFVNYLAGLAGLVIFVGGFLIFRAEKQTLHDQLSETAVYNVADLGPAASA